MGGEGGGCEDGGTRDNAMYTISGDVGLKAEKHPVVLPPARHIFLSNSSPHLALCPLFAWDLLALWD